MFKACILRNRKNLPFDSEEILQYRSHNKVRHRCTDNRNQNTEKIKLFPTIQRCNYSKDQSEEQCKAKGTDTKVCRIRERFRNNLINSSSFILHGISQISVKYILHISYVLNRQRFVHTIIRFQIRADFRCHFIT